MKKLAALLIALTLAGPALAEESCALNGLEPLPVLETIKGHFLRGDYRGFFYDTPNLFPKNEKLYEKTLGALIIAAPKGFDSCSTIMRRAEQGGMVQELVLLGGLNKSGNKDEVMSVLLVTGPVNGETALLYFAFNSQFEKILDEIR